MAALGAAYPVLVEPRWFEITRTRVVLRPGGRDRIRLLHLSDFHASWAVPQSSINKAIGLGLAESPDLICLTGDFITHGRDVPLDAYLTAIRRLTAVEALLGEALSATAS